MSSFMTAIRESFSSRLIKTDDYEQTAKVSDNMFLFQRIQVIVYRIKLDKILLGVLCVVLEIVKNSKKK
jgi:hypothetical protein